jgi:serine O-acetyltransferase
MTHKLTETLTGISISPRAEFGPGLRINHFGGIIVGPGVVAGENCSLSQDVTLGDHRGSPRMGACIYVAPGAKVFGPIVVGDHVAIGANAVVNEDVPSYSTAVAGHATILGGRGNLPGASELSVAEEPPIPGSDIQGQGLAR